MASAPPVNSTGPLKASDADVLSSENNAIKTLATIRNAPMPGEDKAALRDLFLDFAGESDPGRRENLQQEIMKRLPAAEKPKPAVPSTVEPVTTFGRTRLAPQFSVKPPAIEKKETEAPLVAKPPEPEQPKPKAEIPPVPKKDIAAPVASTPVQSGNPKARIDEIKHAINRRFGNPVNLISRDEAVGREYMAALLDAMKQAGTGEASAREALNRLEKAYAAAEKVNADAPIKPEPKAEPKPVAPPVVKKLQPVEVVSKPNPALNIKPIPAAVRSLGKKVPTQQPAPPPPPKKAVVINNPAKAATPSPAKPAPAPIKKTVLSPVSEATTLPEEMTKLRANADKREAEDKKPITDLKAEKVTAGLTQLLAEWKLFKSSGWFGTGSSGINHPLYQQLRGLSMAAVIAGRFEGATPEVKQSITDYMNGWRYEQGMVHEMEESFEHYLRRVILHILERSHDPLAVKKPV